MRSSPRTLFVLWSAVVLLLAGALALRLSRGVQIETDILALLPVTEKDPVIERSIRTFSEHAGRKLVFLVRHPNRVTARVGAAELVKSLEASGLFAGVVYRVDRETEQAYFDLYFPFRFQLLPVETANLLQKEGSGQFLIQKAERALYTPMTGIFSNILEDDPILLFPEWMRALPKPPGSIRVDDEMLMAEQDGFHYVLVHATLNAGVFSRATQKRLIRLLDMIESDFEITLPDLKIYRTGVAFYAAAGAASAEREVSTIGVGSFLGVVLLILFIFRGPGPLFVGLLPILVGLLTAFTASFWIFSGLHLVTIGFGASLIGVCIDYTFHFFCERLGGGRYWTSESGLRHILPGITLGAVTSVLGYMGLLAAPFPGLRQMSVFSIFGLIGAFGTVVCWYPFMMRRADGKISVFPDVADRWLARWSRVCDSKPLLAVLGLLAVITLTGLVFLEPSDDIRLLQTPPVDLKNEEARIREITGTFDSSRFLLVEGETPEETLQREEAVSVRLEEMKTRGMLDHYQGLTAMIPSRAKQAANHGLLKKALTGERQLLGRYLNRLGFSDETRETAVFAVQNDPTLFLTLNDWLSSPASEPLRHLWLGPTSRGYASIVFLAGLTDETAPAQLESAFPGVAYIDKVRDTSDLLRRYRKLALQLVIVSYILILVLLMYRYGPRRGSLILLPPVLASALSLGVMGWLGFPLNLFNTLALLLVLGIGIDYTIFFAESGPDRRGRTMLAIFLSACTTLLAFGLLALSDTAALSTFGFTVLFGIALALLLAPVALNNPKAEGWLAS